MSDQIVRLLYALRVKALDDQRQIAQRRTRPAVPTQQPYDFYSARVCRFDGRHHVRGIARCGDGQAHVAARTQRFDLPREDPFKAGIVGDAGQHAAVRRKRDGRKRSPVFETEAINELAGDVLCVGRRPAITEEQQLFARAKTIGDHQARAQDLSRVLCEVTPLYVQAIGDNRLDTFEHRAQSISRNSFRAFAAGGRVPKGGRPFRSHRRR